MGFFIINFWTPTFSLPKVYKPHPLSLHEGLAIDNPLKCQVIISNDIEQNMKMWVHSCVFLKPHFLVVW